ncbi:DUF7453 family protein [Glaciecola sp. 1036]|uniref:DUF7453 family protein n=1 Tax=Alteromonadaceae TaxID=72275 RepID=UPI003D04C561
MQKILRTQITPKVAALTALTYFSFCNFTSANQTLAVVQTGFSVSDGNGTFSNFTVPTINRSNNIVFTARLADTANGIFDDSGIYQVALPSTIGPGVYTIEQIAREFTDFNAGGKSFELADLFLNSDYLLQDYPILVMGAVGEFNNLALMLPLVPFSGDFGNSIIVAESGSNFELVAEALAPVESGNGVYRGFSVFSLIGMSNNNEVTFFSALNETENGDVDNTAYFKRFNDNSVVELVRKGDSSFHGIFSHIAGAYSNDIGNSVFFGYHGIINSGHTTGIYLAQGNGYGQVVYEGDSAPVESAEPRIFSRLSEARVNNQNNVAFVSRIADSDGFAVTNGTGLFFYNGMSISPVVMEGQSTPDGAATFGAFVQLSGGSNISPAFNDLDQTAFDITILTEDGHQLQGIFLASTDEIIEVARRHDIYDDGTLQYFQDPLINNNGLVLFQADLATQEVIGDEGSYFITDDILIITDGVHYQTVARQGDEVNGKVIKDITINYQSYGTANAFSDKGSVAYRVQYEDFTYGIHVWKPDFGWRNDASTGSWDDITNWNFAGFPDASSDLVFAFDQDIIIQGPSADTSLNSLEIGGGAGQIQLDLVGSQFTVNEPIVIQTGSILSGYGNLEATIENDGSISVPQDQILTVLGNLINTGEISVESGSQLIINGDYSGSEHILGQGLVSLNGSVDLGENPNLIQVAGDLRLQTNANVQLRIQGTERGTQYDAVDVGGAVELTGTLNISLSDSMNLTAGDRFDLLTAGQISGEFDNVQLPETSNSNLNVSLEATATAVTLVVTSTNVEPEPPTPEPESDSGGGSLGLFVLFLLLISYYRRLYKH